MKNYLYIFLTLSFMILVTGCNRKKYYTISECAYCGANSKIEDGSVTITSPQFPSKKPPEHRHLFIPLAGHNEGMYWDGTSGATTVLQQLRKLNVQGQLSEDTIKEWFSINVGNPDVLKAFAEKHNLKLTLTSQDQ